MRLIDIEQGNPDWLKWRMKGLGASDATIIMGLSPWFSRDQLLRRKVKEIRETMSPKSMKAPKEGKEKGEADNGAMARGRRMEPIARDLYSDLTGIKTRPICAIHDELDWMRASFDGLSDDGKVVLEVKCVNQFDHGSAVEGMVPPKYVPQVQHQLMIHGGPVLHYWSYTDNASFAPKDRAALVEVKPDPQYQMKLLEAETLFWKEVQGKLQKPSWLDK